MQGLAPDFSDKWAVKTGFADVLWAGLEGVCGVGIRGTPTATPQGRGAARGECRWLGALNVTFHDCFWLMRQTSP
jgi:hypothetical protein